MSRINTNVNSLIAQRVLGQNNQGLAGSLERLSTGLRINRGKDDPAGLIASQNLRAEKASLSSAIKNAERADQVVNIAEGGLNEVSGLLTELQGLLTTTANDAGLSAEEKEANQLQIDSILQTIDRVSSATSFQGKKLLNGNLDYTTTSIDSEVSGFKVNGAKLGFGETRDVEVLVTQSAQVGGMAMRFTGTALDLTDADSTYTIEIAGNEGSRELSFSSGTTLATIASTINSFTDVTGVVATASGNDIKLVSSEYGSDQFVSLKVIDDGGAAGTGVDNLDAGDTNALAGSPTAFNALTNGITDFGQDVAATINGISATTKGTKASINTDFLDVSVDLSETGSTTLGSISAFTITGGGGDFQLGGRVDISGKVSLGIGNVAVREIGKVEDSGTNYSLADIGSGKSLNVVDGDLSVAQDAVEQAIKDVNSLRGRLGAFQQNTVGATIRSLGVSFENTAAAESVIRDTDFASETAALTRSQILSQSAQTVLSQANFQPQAALSLLG
ncbi:MAG: flagellin [Phycisphaerales bacterium JB065]